MHKQKKQTDWNTTVNCAVLPHYEQHPSIQIGYKHMETRRSRTLLGSNRGLTQSVMRYMSSSSALRRFESLVLLSPSIIGERRFFADMPR